MLAVGDEEDVRADPLPEEEQVPVVGFEDRFTSCREDESGRAQPQHGEQRPGQPLEGADPHAQGLVPVHSSPGPAIAVTASTIGAGAFAGEPASKGGWGSYSMPSWTACATSGPTSRPTR